MLRLGFPESERQTSRARHVDRLQRERLCWPVCLLPHLLLLVVARTALDIRCGGLVSLVPNSRQWRLFLRGMLSEIMLCLTVLLALPVAYPSRDIELLPYVAVARYKWDNSTSSLVE